MVVLELKNVKSVTVSTFSPSIYHEVMGPDGMLCSLTIEFYQLFHLFLSPSSRGSLVPLYFLPLEWYYLTYKVIDISPGNLDSSLSFIQLAFYMLLLLLDLQTSFSGDR